MPASLTYPGVYIEELPSNVHTIAGVATSIAAFIGWAPQGPTTEAVLVEGFSQFQSIFGGFTPGVYLAYAVNQFFANGGTQAYVVRLVWDGSITPSPTTSPAVAATAVAAGIGFASAQITASVGAIVSKPVTVDIGQPVLQSLLLGPANLPTIPLGAQPQLTVSGLYADGSTGALAGPVKWSSSNASVTVSSTGLLTANAVGSAVVTASSGLASASMTLTVDGAAVSSIAVNPSSFPLAAGQTQQVGVIATLNDGTTRDVSAIATWTLPAGAQFEVTPAGLVTPNAGAAGSETLGASLAAVGGAFKTSGPTDAAIALGAALPVSLALYPSSAVVNAQQKFSYAVRATNTDGSFGLASSPTWASSNLGVATIDGTGLVTPVATGTSVITVNSGALSASATITVTPATLKAISVTPLTASVACGKPVQLSATGLYSDGSSVDLTQSVSWTPATAYPLPIPLTTNTVDAFTGLVTTGQSGVTTAMTATVPWQNATLAQVDVTVGAPVVAAIAITTPSTASTSIPAGQTTALAATATMSNGQTVSPVPGLSWVSSAPTVVSVNPTSGVATAVATGGSLTLFASSPGAWGNNLLVSVLPGSDPTRFGLLVQQTRANGAIATLESFVNLSIASVDPQYAVAVVDNDSNYITFINPQTSAPVIPTATPSPTASAIALSGGADGARLVPASDQNFELALLADDGGVNLLDRVDIFNLLCVPGETDEVTIGALQRYCAGKRAMLIVDAPPLATAASLFNSGPIGTNPGAGITGLPNAANSAYYFPWVLAPDPAVGNRPTLFPPCGFVAGIYAATDADRGVWKAPAGVNASLTGESGLQYVLTDAENGNLNPQAINCLRQFKVYGDVVWGARTLAGADQVGSQWKYVPIRRVALYIESSLLDGTQWVVFEPNDETLWGQIRLNVGAFMQGLFLEGAFAGTTPSQAYFVKCDADNNPPASVALGVVNVLVGFSPLYPAEFVVIQIQQIAAQAS